MTGPAADRPAWARKPPSKRELEVLRLMATGLDYAAIGDRLGIRGNTVKTTCMRLFLKLGVHTRAEAVAIGCHNGLIPPPPGNRPDPQPEPEPSHPRPIVLDRGVAAVMALVLDQVAAGHLTPAVCRQAAAVRAALRAAREAAGNAPTAPIPTQRTGNHP